MSRFSSETFHEITPLVLSAHTAVQSRGDASFPFVQEAHFLWLTSIDHADWWYVATDDTEYLVMPEVDEVHELFDGSLSKKEAEKLSGIKTILSRKEGMALIESLAEKHQTVFTLGEDPHVSHYDFVENPAPKTMRTMLSRHFREVKDARPVLSRLRAIKSEDEIKATEKAVKATILGFEEVRTKLSTLKYEYEIEAILNAAFRKTGAHGHAYDPIVAAEKNACTLHYVQNNDKLPKNGLVLIDAGAKFSGYAADVTRTYAIGTPTARQSAVHHAVEKAHQEIISLVRPGLKISEYSERVDEIMKAALKSLNLLSAPEDYRRYFPHAISHGLGIDVHESLGGSETFKPGMIFTVEPGIYIPEESIGVRIEDDILVTDDGHRVLSEALPTGL